MTTVSNDPYVTLGLASTATPVEVRRAFRALVHRHHPDTRQDVAPAQEAAADALLQEILAAYHLLGDPHRRAAYDRSRGIRSSSSGAKVGARSPQTPWIVAGPVRWH
ncbi:MAG: J domain-containing protein, partial [Marmoricola sp.]